MKKLLKVAQGDQGDLQAKQGDQTIEQRMQGWRGSKMAGIDVSRFALPDTYRVIEPPMPLRGDLSLYFCMNRFLTRAFRNPGLESDMGYRPQGKCEDLRSSLLRHLRGRKPTLSGDR